MNEDQTFAQDIEEVAQGEPILFAVIGASPRNYGTPDERYIGADARKGEILTWDEARPLLDYEYDDGYGGADCHPVHVWTENKVIFVHEYDGSTYASYVPRNPSPLMPKDSGRSIWDEETQATDE